MKKIILTDAARNKAINEGCVISKAQSDELAQNLVKECDVKGIEYLGILDGSHIYEVDTGLHGIVGTPVFIVVNESSTTIKSGWDFMHKVRDAFPQ